MKEMFLTSVLTAAIAALPVFSAENAASVYEAERSKAMDPSKFQLRGDTPDLKYNYKVGEEITFNLRFDCGRGYNVKGWQILVNRFGEDGVKEEKKFPVENGKTVAYKTKGAKPGFVIVKATVLDEKEQTVMIPNGSRKRALAYTGGIGVELEKIKAPPFPEDFDSYWDNEIKKVYASPEKAKLTPAPARNPKEKLYIFQIPCGKGMESTGYLSMPAAPGKYPITAIFSGYGPVTSVSKPRFNPKQIQISVSRFGIIPGKDKAYYAEKEKGLQNYGFMDNDSRETSFFKGMIIRNLTALKFAKSLPEWDRKNLTVAGASLGGLQTLWMAGLDKDITVAKVSCPWCCNLQPPELKRFDSLVYPKFTPELQYFDAVNFAHRIPKTCRANLFTGIGDDWCLVSDIFRTYISIPGPKSITLIQGPTHAPCHKNPQLYKFNGNPAPAE